MNKIPHALTASDLLLLENINHNYELAEKILGEEPYIYFELGIKPVSHEGIEVLSGNRAQAFFGQSSQEKVK